MHIHNAGKFHSQRRHSLFLSNFVVRIIMYLRVGLEEMNTSQ